MNQLNAESKKLVQNIMQNRELSMNQRLTALLLMTNFPMPMKTQDHTELGIQIKQLIDQNKAEIIGMCPETGLVRITRCT